MDYKPYTSTLSLLFDTAFGQCVDIGTGYGTSYSVLKFCGDTVVGIENDINYLQNYATYLPEIKEEHVQDFDFGFVDHFPLEQRWTVAHWLVETGAEVVVDDAKLLTQNRKFHRHANAYHYSPKGCQYVDINIY
jgi:hypothetical protein